MRTITRLLFVVPGLLACSLSASAQKVTMAGEAVVGLPGDGNSLLTFNTERSWVFRQIGTGPSTGLELFSTVGLKNFIITSTGNVGIGEPAPIEKLHVNGNIKATGIKIAFGSSEYFSDGGGFLIDCNGTMESTLDGTDDLGRSGRRWRTVWASNGTISTSDAKVKSNIQSIPYGLKDIMLLRPVSFEWKDQPQFGTKLGLVAQDVQRVIGEVVVDHDFIRDEITGQIQKVPAANLGMYYSDLIPVLIKAVQEQEHIIEEKDARISTLEIKTELLEARLAKLEKLILSAAPASGN